eukprot:8534207-Pyramimonas_sp.AAC.1
MADMFGEDEMDLSAVPPPEAVPEGGRGGRGRGGRGRGGGRGGRGPRKPAAKAAAELIKYCICCGLERLEKFKFCEMHKRYHDTLEWKLSRSPKATSETKQEWKERGVTMAISMGPSSSAHLVSSVGRLSGGVWGIRHSSPNPHSSSSRTLSSTTCSWPTRSMSLRRLGGPTRVSPLHHVFARGFRVRVRIGCWWVCVVLGPGPSRT